MMFGLIYNLHSCHHGYSTHIQIVLALGWPMTENWKCQVTGSVPVVDFINASSLVAGLWEVWFKVLKLCRLPEAHPHASSPDIFAQSFNYSPCEPLTNQLSHSLLPLFSDIFFFYLRTGLFLHKIYNQVYHSNLCPVREFSLTPE